MTVENLTTVIGTNASGKTNAIEGIKILSELMTGRELSTILDGSKNMDSDFCDCAMRGEGFGDLSIIRSYEQYKEETLAISHIRICSKDTHLQAYEEVHMPIRRNRRSI